MPDLQRLSQELRSIYTSVQRDAIANETQLIGNAIDLALKAPLRELLYTVYCNTLEQDLPHLQTIHTSLSSLTR